MVVETVVHLAHNSGMATVAEGVETALHAAIVREFDVRRRPGLLLRPAAAAEDSATGWPTSPTCGSPSTGPGWQSDDDWPFPGVEAEAGGTSGAAGAAALRANGRSPAAQLDAIDLVEMALEAPRRRSRGGARRHGRRRHAAGGATTGRPRRSAGDANRRPRPAGQGKPAEPAAKPPARPVRQAGGRARRQAGQASQPRPPRPRPPRPARPPPGTAAYLDPGRVGPRRWRDLLEIQP